jgi:hypothetical protein
MYYTGETADSQVSAYLSFKNQEFALKENKDGDKVESFSLYAVTPSGDLH